VNGPIQHFTVMCVMGCMGLTGVVVRMLDCLVNVFDLVGGAHPAMLFFGGEG